MYPADRHEAFIWTYPQRGLWKRIRTKLELSWSTMIWKVHRNYRKISNIRRT